MTHFIGDPGHIDVHNDLRDALQAQATRIGVSIVVPEARTVGELGHVDDHAAIVAALEALHAGAVANDWGIAALPSFTPKSAGSLGHVDDHNAYDEALAILAAATPGYNDATGGTVTTYFDAAEGKAFRVHTFTADGTFEVTQDSGRPYSVLVVAGGQGGGGDMSRVGGTGGGVVEDNTETIAVGSYPITVGSGGGIANPGNPGGPSTAFGITANPGAGAGGGSPSPGSGPETGGDGGTGTQSTITGSAAYYGSGGGGGGGINGSPGNSGPGTYGRGGRASNWSSAGFGGENGQPGVVIVSYEVAPMNAATGGTTSDVHDYNGTGETWRVHEFTADGSFEITQAVQPFHVLVSGAGGAGGPVGAGRGGGGGGGGAVTEVSQAIAAGTYPVVIGNPSSVAGITANGGGNGGEGSTGHPARNGGTSGNGNIGGNNDASTWCSGGGGGAGGVGYDAPGNGNGGGGGPGVSSTITGAAVTYGAGGAGGAQSPGAGGQSGAVVIAYRIG